MSPQMEQVKSSSWGTVPRSAERKCSRNDAGKSDGTGRTKTSASGDALLQVKQCGALATLVAAVPAGWGPAENFPYLCLGNFDRN